MGNEGPYGGKIEVRKDGSVVWQVAEREFARDRDTDGSLEYAIRIATRDRNSFTSRDGKCVIGVNVPESSLNVQGSGTDKAKFLIVSGYETPDSTYDSIVVGKSYFITYGRYLPLEASPIIQSQVQGTGPETKPSVCDETPWDQLPDDPNQVPFHYDLSIRYDDQDLERAGLSAALEPTKLEVCYQNFVSLRDVFRHYYCKEMSLVINIRQHEDVSPADRGTVLDRYNMDLNSLQIALIWNKTYRHLEMLGIKRSLLDDIGKLFRNDGHDQGEHGHQAVEDERESPPDVVFSRWMSVTEDPVTTSNGTDGTEPENASPDPIAITAKDLQAVPGKPVITATPLVVLGSRTITLRNLSQPGTFVLMHHSDPNPYDQRERAD